MNETQQQILDILKDLKENYGALRLKAEFEDEGANFKDIRSLKKYAVESGLGLTVKIGGCSALSDMYQARKAGANTVVAPMVESPYAASKFLKFAKQVFDKTTRLFVNIETKYAINYAKDILEQDLDGIILGRTDLACSLGLGKDAVNSDEILEIAKEISGLAKDSGKEFIVGGGVCGLSVPFFLALPYITGFETRKVIFDIKSKGKNDIEKGILKAIDFELMWLNNNNGSSQNQQRVKALRTRTMAAEQI